MSYFLNLLFIFSLIFIAINHLFFAQFLFIISAIIFYDKVDEKSEEFSNFEISVLGYCLAFAWFFAHFSL